MKNTFLATLAIIAAATALNAAEPRTGKHSQFTVNTDALHAIDMGIAAMVDAQIASAVETAIPASVNVTIKEQSALQFDLSKDAKSVSATLAEGRVCQRCSLNSPRMRRASL